MYDGQAPTGAAPRTGAKRRGVPGGAALKLLLLVLPWPLRRRLLTLLLGYDLHPTSRIGLSWAYPRHLVLKEGASIGHLTLAKGLDLIELGAHSSIGNLNWITAHPSGGVHFRHVPDRSPSLALGDHAAITSHHFFDCATRITIGDFTTVAGMHCQFFTHNLDVMQGRQDCRPIEIGSYCLIATGTVVLAGSVLPSYSVLSAMSLLNKQFSETHRLYAGVPAAALRSIPADARYFTRTRGFVE